LKTVLFTDKGTMCKVEFIRVFTAPLSFPEKRLFAIFTVMETTKLLGGDNYHKIKKILLFKLKYYHQSEVQAIYT
jgi:hypothetical protein